LFASLAVAGVAAAQQADRAIKYRQGVMGGMGWHMGAISRVVKGERPFNKDEVVARTAYVDQLAHMPWEGFTPGSHEGAPTKAKPEIWKEQAKFKQYQEQLQVQTAKLVTSAKSAGDANALKGAVGDVAKACDNCHDDFRNK
jgi:cytochrome c556